MIASGRSPAYPCGVPRWKQNSAYVRPQHKTNRRRLLYRVSPPAIFLNGAGVAVPAMADVNPCSVELGCRDEVIRIAQVYFAGRVGADYASIPGVNYFSCKTQVYRTHLSIAAG